MSKLLIDLDRTLFDTASFVDSLWSWMAAEYGVDSEKERERGKQQFYNYVGDMYDYDFFAHIQDLGIDKDDLDKQVRQVLRPSFEFPDVEEFLERTADADRAILTFGNEPYQSFKLSFCPQLLGLMPVYMTTQSKPGYIESHWPGEPTILIDDKQLAGTLPETTRFIHLDRMQEASIVEREGYLAVNSLAAISRERLV